MSTFFIIEHPTQGVLKDLEETEGGKIGHFTWSGSRNDEEVMRFSTILDAANARCSITPLTRQAKCQVRRSTPLENSGPMGNIDWPIVA